MKTALPTPLMDAWWARGLQLPAPLITGPGAATADFLAASMLERSSGSNPNETSLRRSITGCIDR